MGRLRCYVAGSLVARSRSSAAALSVPVRRLCAACVCGIYFGMDFDFILGYPGEGPQFALCFLDFPFPLGASLVLVGSGRAMPAWATDGFCAVVGTALEIRAHPTPMLLTCWFR